MCFKTLVILLTFTLLQAASSTAHSAECSGAVERISALGQGGTADAAQMEQILRTAAAGDCSDEAVEILDAALNHPSDSLRTAAYAEMLRRVAADTSGFSAASVERARFHLARLELRLPGHKVPDIPLISPDGTPSTLYTVTSGEPSLLVLFDPWCESCQAYVESIGSGNCPDLTAGVKPVAVNISTDSEALTSFLSGSLPLYTASTDLEEEPLMDLSSSPTVFLLDTDHRIIRQIR